MNKKIQSIWFFMNYKCNTVVAFLYFLMLNKNKICIKDSLIINIINLYVLKFYLELSQKKKKKPHRLVHLKNNKSTKIYHKNEKCPSSGTNLQTTHTL